jgi:RNA polymerase sigma factor (sigma-70 family)
MSEDFDKFKAFRDLGPKIPTRDIMSGLPDAKLTPSEESACVAAKDYEKLILHNLRDAVLYAGRCCRGNIEPGELLSLCYAALSKSAPRFRPGGIPFLAYSKADIRGETSRHWKSLDCVHNSYRHRSEDEPVIKRTLLTSGCQEAEEITFEWEGRDEIEDSYTEPEFDAIALRERWELVRPIIAKALNERERTVLQLTYEAGFTYEQIAKLVVPRVVREAIRMTHDRALRKIRNVLLRRKQLYTTV